MALTVQAKMDNRLGETFRNGEAVENPQELHPAIVGTIGDVEYRRYGDGSASFNQPNLLSSWDVSCKVDAMDDKPYCVVRLRAIAVAVSPGCVPRIAIGQNHYPGSEKAIRVDGKAVLNTNDRDGVFDLARSRAIVASLRRAHSAKTRYMMWPSRSWEDDEISMLSFAEAMDYACWALTRLPK